MNNSERGKNGSRASTMEVLIFHVYYLCFNISKNIKSERTLLKVEPEDKTFVFDFFFHRFILRIGRPYDVLYRKPQLN